MHLTNTAARYGTIAKLFHWSIAAGILAMIPMGIVAANLPYDTPEALARKAALFSVHKTLGVALFALALARIAWALSQPKPAPLHPERRAETLLADVAHKLLYGSLILVPLSGWVHHAATDGFAPILWPLGQSLPLVPKSADLASVMAGAHIVFERVLVLSLLLHVAGALKHHVVDRDATLRRMWFGKAEAGHAQAAPVRALVPAAALAGLTWIGALGLGAGLGVFSGHAGAAPAPQLVAQVQSDWQVTDGTLGIGVQQMGQSVTGSFADWTAEIAYEDTPGDGEKGRVTVRVAIPSLTLGSVTAQALGTDYFDAATFPTARFTAPILREEGRLVARGTLELRGAEVPVTLPFSLDVQGNMARMQGAVSLDRRAFGIGAAMTDPAQLGFEVEVTVALEAERAAP